MSDILSVDPSLDITSFAHILPSLEKSSISTADLLTCDSKDIARRAAVPPGEVKKLCDALVEALHAGVRRQRVTLQVDAHSQANRQTWRNISTLDDKLDAALGGGIAPGYLTEIVGESAVGKTQFLLTLLLSVQLSSPRGLSKSALYISTEAPLQTTRLAQILQNHPTLSQLPSSERPSLSRVHSTHIHDVEAQEHIIRYQVPIAIGKQNIGLLVIDSIAANYRAEFDRGKARKGAEAFAKRSNQLSHLGALLRDIAQRHGIAIVMANQVADRFTTIEPPNLASQSTQRSRPHSPPQSLISRSATMSQHAAPDSSNTLQMLSTDDPLALDHQQRFFTGWGDDQTITNLKTPSLGLTWTNQLATRIALLKDPIYEDKLYQIGEDRNVIDWKRTMKVVFSAWSAESRPDFQIWEGGIQAMPMQQTPND